jgi:hypothetical protein
MTMNLYVYTRDNPERYVDPSGHRLLSTNTLYGGGSQYIPPPTTSSSTMTWTDYQKKHVWAGTATAPASAMTTKPKPEDFQTWIQTSGFFQDPTHQQQLALVFVDIAAMILQAGAVEIFRGGLQKAAVSVLFAGSALASEGLQLVQDLYNHNLPGAVSNGLSLASDTIQTFVNGLSFWDKLGFVAAVGLNWGGDIFSAGDLAAAGDILAGSALAVDASTLVFEMTYAYGQYVASFGS